MTDHNARQAGLTDAKIDEIAAPFLQLGDGDTEHDTIDWRGFARAVIAAHSADARNGEGVALAQEMRWRDVSVEKPTQAQQVLFVRNGKVHFGAWINDIFWYSNEKVCALYWMPLPEAPTLAAPAAPAPKCSECKGTGVSDGRAGALIPCLACKPAPAPAAQADERELDLYDEIECDLPALFGRASTEGHEAGQALAAQLQAKMRKARQQSATPADATSGADKWKLRFETLHALHEYKPSMEELDIAIDAAVQRERQQGADRG